MRLSDHFTLDEATKSQVALRLGIPNTPPSIYYPRLKAVAEKILEPCRAHFGGRPIVPSSWYRCPELNRAIGSSSRSQHIEGFAVDFEVPGVPNIDVAAFIRDELAFDQLILEYYDAEDPNGGWVHCSYVPSGSMRKQALTFDGRGYTAGLPA